jgi:hypothetical protein
MRSLLTANDPGDVAVAGDCGEEGHYARECKKPRDLTRRQPQQRVGFHVHRDGLNVLARNTHVQYCEQEQYEAEILDLRNHVALQNMLMREAREQEYARMAPAGGGVPSGTVAQVAATGVARGPQVIWSPPLIVGGDQPTLADGVSYVRVGQTIQDSPIWGHPDIVSASIPEDFRRAIPDTADIWRGFVIAPRCIFVFCISDICAAYCCICAAYCCVLHANWCAKSPQFFCLLRRFSKIDGLTEEDKCDTV